MVNQYLTKEAGAYNGAKTVSSINGVGRSGMVHAKKKRKEKKKETRSPNYSIHQNKLKMNKRLKHKLQHHNSPQGKHRQDNFRYPT